MPNIYVKNINIDESKFRFFNIRENKCFSIHGLMHDGIAFRRMPEEVAKTVSPAVHGLHDVTAGGRVRFTTDSKTIVLKVELQNIHLDSNTTLTCNAGFDIYERKERHQYFVGNFMPPFELTDAYTDFLTLGDKKERELVINFPMCSGVKELYIGIEEDASLCPPTDYTLTRPVVFYGSSITMGKCATRPGCIYENILSQRLDFDFVNLGFGGAAKGEQEIADYIASLDASLFVLDYDHNAPTVEHLKKTHLNFYETVRKANPTLPILMMTRPKYDLTDEETRRLNAVKENYEKALADGDKNVYFIPGNTLMDDFICDGGTIDGIHPTDAGFFSMARKIFPLVKEILSLG